MEDIIKIAASQLGVKEIIGNEDNPKIVNYAKEAGFKNISDDETPWCSIFVNWCCLKAGLQRTNRANARSWLSVGKPVDNPVPGDIVVFWRESLSSWKGHVGIFFGYSKDKRLVYVLGGNQKNCVSVQGYDASKVLGFRQLAPSDKIDIPKPDLKKGDRGDEVKKLQRILNDLGYFCGSVDGIFGPRTESKLIEFQTEEEIKHSNGIYNTRTKERIESIYMS
jgi:uncharacterized protein (TIGR02594 family)